MEQEQVNRGKVVVLFTNLLADGWALTSRAHFKGCEYDIFLSQMNSVGLMMWIRFQVYL